MMLSWWKRKARRRFTNSARQPRRKRRRDRQLRLEPLEDRRLLTAGLSELPTAKQLFYLDLDGAQGVDYDGPVRIADIDVPALQLPGHLVGEEQVVEEAMLDSLRQALAGQDVQFTTRKPATAAFSTIYVGGNGAPFTQFGFYLGLAESVDVGNQNPSDEALVFSDLIAPYARTPREFAEQLAKVVAHEAGHLLGAAHSDAAHHDHRHERESLDPLAEVAFKVQTHVEMARDVRRDLLEDGQLTIDGRQYDVHPLVLEAITKYPAHYYGGTVGPDAFPDLVYGQGVVHPIDTGTWLTRVLDMAWAAQSSDAYLAEEKLQILAWSYGFVTHAAGDYWAHTLVNEFTEGIFPSFTTLPTNARNFANAARHFLMENYIGDATPGQDNDSERSLLPDGDISSDSSPAQPYDAPHRFVYEALIKPFDGQPSSSRGVLIDGILEMQSGLRLAAEALGPRPAVDFNLLIRDVFQQLVSGETVPQETLDTLYLSYLYNWIDDIDAGLENWSELGLAIANGLTNQQSKRDLQNEEGAPLGSDIDARRAAAESDVSGVDALLHELDDPNGDGRTDDSFINNHLLPMFGVPRDFAQFRGALQDFGAALGAEIAGPLRLALNPILEQLDRLAEIPKEFVKQLIEQRFGLDVDQFELLGDLSAKLDLATLLSPAGVIVPMYKPDARERLDALMGIDAAAHSGLLDERIIDSLPIATFHEGAIGPLNPNVEFDKEKFAAYANAVTLSKLLLLQETPVDGESVGAGELSRFFSDQTGQPYDFGLLNLNGAHGGNILTTTLPKPGVTVEVVREDGSVETALSDERPALVSIDADHAWRADSQTRTTENYRVHPAGDGADAAVWTFAGLAAGTYELQASWLANVNLTPTRHATYRVFDGELDESDPNALLAPFTVDQHFFSDDVEADGLLYRSLGDIDFSGGTLRIKLASESDGEVLAGPLRLVSKDAAIEPLKSGPTRDGSGVVVQGAGGYEETGAGWVDLKYSTGTGNNPLWESELLRPVFRRIFVDWQNGGEQFPDLGDMPSPDPNLNPSIVSSPLPPIVSVFETPTVEPLPDGEDFVISGVTELTFSRDLVLGTVTGDGDTLADSLTLRVDGEVLITEFVGGRGLNNLVIEATGGIRIAPGVTVASRQFEGVDPLGGKSIGDSGDIVLVGASIDIGAGSRLLAGADAGFAAGDIVLAAASEQDLDWFLGIEGFRLAISRATIDVGLNAVLDGRNIDVSTLASTSKAAELSLDLPPGIESELGQQIDELDLIEFNAPAAAIFSDAEAAIRIAAGALLRADADIALDAHALAEASITTEGKYLGATFGSTNPTAIVEVAAGVTISAGGALSLLAHSDNTLDITTVVPAAGETANVSVSYGKADAVSKADVAAGASIEAATASIRAENVNSIRNRALAAGFPDSGTAGIGATVVLGSYQSSASARVAGSVNVSGDLNIDARSINTTNESRAFGAVVDPVDSGPLLEELERFFADVSLSQEIDGQTFDPVRGGGPDFAVAGAVVLVQSDNKAAAMIDDGALVTVGGNLTVSSRAEEPFRASATGSAGDSDQVSVGGAVAFSKVGNQATSFLGYNAIVDAAGMLNLDADAVVLDDADPFDPTLLLPSAGTASGTGRIAESYDEGAAVRPAVETALLPLDNHLDQFGRGGASPTTFVHAGSGADPEGTTGIAGGVSIVTMYNAGVAGIAAGARVNERMEALPADQDVVIDAQASIEATALAGLDSPLNFGSGIPAAENSIGGFFSGLLLDNRAKAYIDDRTEVAAGRDVLLRATTTSEVLSVVEAGADGAEIGVDGAFAVVSLRNETAAYVEDRARVDAGRDLDALADSNALVVNTTGGVVRGGNVGVGASASLTTIDNSTRAFIGDPQQGFGPEGTGGVEGRVAVGRDLRLNADSHHELWTAATSGGNSDSVGRAAAASEEFEGLQFGFGVSADVAYNRLRDETQAFIRDVPDVSAGGAMQLDAQSSNQLVAAAGAVTFGDHLGLGGSFAHNAVVHDTQTFAQDAALRGASLGLTADTDDQIVTLSLGSAGAATGGAVAGSANLNRLDNVTEAALAARTEAEFAGNVSITAHDATDLNSVAGATAESGGLLGIGAALDLGYVDKTVRAYVGDESRVKAGGDVDVLSSTDDRVLSVSASMAESARFGEPTRLYLNNGTARPFFGSPGQDVTGDDSLTTSVALGDIDGDGDLDLVTGNFAQFNRAYLNGGLGVFDAGTQIGTDLLVPLRQRELPGTRQLINSLLPDLTMAVLLVDVNGDGALDVISGNLGQANRVYLNGGKGSFSPGDDVGRFDLTVTFDPAVTADNNSLEELRIEIEAAVIDALLDANLSPDDVTVEIDEARDRIILRAPSRVLGFLQAENAIAAARRDGVLETDAAGSPLAFKLAFDGEPVQVAINPASTLDNRSLLDLRRDAQAAVDDGLAAIGRQAGEIQVAIREGRLVFALRENSLGDTAAAEFEIAKARDGDRIKTDPPDALFTFSLVYNGRAIEVTLDPRVTEDNGTVKDLRDDFQAAVDAALTSTGAGVAGDVLVEIAPDESLVFALAEHTFSGGETGEALIAAARRIGRLATDDGGPLVFRLFLSDADLTRSVAAGDVDGDGDVDLVAGNLNQVNRLYLNDGDGNFGIGFDITTDVGLTTSVALGDVDGDDDLDLIAGNVNIDLVGLFDQRLVTIQNFVDGLTVKVSELVQSTAVTLLDLVESNLLSRFDFNQLADLSIADLVNSGLVRLQDLVRGGLLALSQFVDLPIAAVDLIDSLIVSLEELQGAGLIDALGNVSLHDLVNSGFVFLEEVLGVELVGLGELNIGELSLGELLHSGFVELQELIEAALLDGGDLIRDQLDVRKLLDAGLVKLGDLIGANLLGGEDLDLSSLSLSTLTAGLGVAGPTRLYLNDGLGNFAAGVDVTTDEGVTMSVALGDVDGDNDLDLVLGNSGQANRLYLNFGDGTFGPGADLTSDADRTQQVLLGDYDGDADLDLIVANFGQPNKTYRNDGLGHFVLAAVAGTQADLTTSVALGDVNGDLRPDLIAGNARPTVGASGSGGLIEMDRVVQAYVGEIPTSNSETGRVANPTGTFVTAGENVTINADDQLEAAMIVGAAASGGSQGIGLSAGRTNIDRAVEAYVGVADVNAGGRLNPLPRDIVGVAVSATTDDDLLTYVAGSASARNLGVAASAIYDSSNSLTSAFAHDGATIRAENRAAANLPGVRLTARHETQSLGVAGSFGDAARIGAGAALDFELHEREVLAGTSPSARVDAQGAIVVAASMVDDVESVAGGTATAGEIAIAGSVSLIRPDTRTRASVAGDLFAEGNIVVTADRESTVTSGAGAASFGGQLGAGASAAALIGNHVVEAVVESGARLIALGDGDTTLVRTDHVEPDGSLLRLPVRGVVVTADSNELIRQTAAGGQDAGRKGAAGSLVFTALEQVTRAVVSPFSFINMLPTGTVAHDDQDVHVWAYSNTVRTAQAGASLAGNMLGVGAGVDFSAISKQTEASLGGDVNANRHIFVQALSTEEFASLSGTTGLASAVSFGGSASAFTADVVTRSFIADGARVRALGSIAVEADNASEIDVIAGNRNAAGAVAGGASVDAVVLEKTAEAFIGRGAVVDALGQVPGIEYNVGDFRVLFVPEQPAAGEVAVPGLLGTLLDVLAIVFDLDPVRQFLGDFVSSMISETAGPAVADALDIISIAAPDADPSLVQRRVSTPNTAYLGGLAVSATSRSDVESIAVGLGAGGLAVPQLSATGAVLTGRTSSFIDDDAQINQEEAPDSPYGQSVLVVAGDDTYVMGIAGAATAGGITAGPSGALTLIDHLSEAFIASGAVVNARDHVQTFASAVEDLLMLSGNASAALASQLSGAVDVLSLNSRVHAFIADGATALAGGTVSVRATDFTDADLIGGAASVGLGTGRGASAALTVVDKDTQAFIGKGAVVDALAQNSSTPGFFPTIRGVDVRAESSEDIFSVVASGATGLGQALAGSVNFVVLDSDTAAYIDADARINTNQAGASASQSVNVAAKNDAQVFGVAGSLVAGGAALAGGADIGVLRNDTSAWIGPGAIVNALQDVDVTVESTKDVSSFVSGAGLGPTFGVSLYSIHADFDQTLFGKQVLDFLNVGADDIQQYIDGQVLALTDTAGSGLGGLLSKLSIVVGPAGEIVAQTLAASSPSSAAGNAVDDVDVGEGNTAKIDGAQITAGRDVRVTAVEQIHAVADTSFTYNFGAAGPLLDFVSNLALLNAGGSANASIVGGAVISAGQDVIVDARIDETSIIVGTNSLNNSLSSAAAFIDGSTVDAGRNAVVSAESLANASYSALLPGFFGGTRFYDSRNKVRNTVDAHITSTHVTTGGSVDVLAEETSILSITVNATALGSAAFDIVSVGAAITANDIANTITAYIEDSTVEAIGGGVTVGATSSPTITAVSVGAARASETIAAAGSDSRNIINNTIEARISGESRVDAFRTVRVSAVDNARIVAAAGGLAAGFGDAAVGAAASRNTLTNQVLAVIENASVDAGSVNVLATSNAVIKGIAGSVSGADTFAAGGSIVLNDIANIVDAHVASSTVRTAGKLLVQATDNPSILAIAGGAAISGTAVVGAAFATNDIRDVVTAYLEDTSVPAAQSVEVRATADAGIEAVTASGGGSGTFSAGGSIALNAIDMLVDAHIVGATTIDASGLVSLSAADESSIRSVAATAQGAGAAAIGGAVGTNDIGTIVNASITDGAITAGRVEVTAVSSAEIETLSAGVGIATNGIAATGGVAVNDIHGTITALVTGDAVVETEGDILLSARDTSTISSLAGQAALSFGGAGIGAAAAYNHIHRTIRASLNQGTLTAGGSVAIDAGESAAIETIAAGGSFGGAFSAAGSVAANIMENAIEASIRSATVLADHNVTLLAESDNSITTHGGVLGISGAVGFNGTLVVNTLENKTQAFVDRSTVFARGLGATTAIKRFDPDTGVETTEQIRGLAIVATAREDVDTKTATGGFAGGFALSGDVTVTNVADLTEAYLRGSNVNSAADPGESVIVRAHQDTNVDGLAGSVALGAGAIGGTVDTTLVHNTTRASIDAAPAKAGPSTSSQVRARDVDVSATTRERVAPGVAAFAAGSFGVAGAVTVVNIGGLTEALVSESDVSSRGDLRIAADDTATIISHAGALGGGLLGAGASVAVNTIKHTTRAEARGASLNATGVISISADSDELIDTLVGTAGGGVVGLAGSVLVDTIEATTEALTTSTAMRSTQINQHADFRPGGPFAPQGAVEQIVQLTADDKARIEGIGGAIAAGVVGVGASIDVSAIRNRTVALVGAGTRIFAADGIEVLSHTDRDVDSSMVVGGIGLVGVSGAVSVVSLGTAVDATAANEFDRQGEDQPAGKSTLRSQVNSDIANRDPKIGAGDGSVANVVKQKLAGLTSPNINSALNTNLDDSPFVTGALIEDGAASGQGAELVSGGGITIVSENVYDVDVLVGQLSAGLASFGASVGVARVNNRVHADVGEFGVLDAAGDIQIAASDRQRSGASRVNALSGQAGLFSAGGAVANLRVTADTDAHVSSDAVIGNAGDVTIDAGHSANLDVDARGLTVGLVAVGGVFATAEVQGTVQAHVEDDAVIGSAGGDPDGAPVGDPDVGSLTVSAGSDSVADTFSRGSTAGVVSGSYSQVTSRVRPNVKAFIDDDASVAVDGDVALRSTMSGRAESFVDGQSAGGVTIGGSTSTAQMTPTLDTFIGAADVHAGRNITLETIHDGGVVDAMAEGSTGALIGISAASATATASAIAKARIESGATIEAGHTVAVYSTAKNQANSFTDGFAIGLIGVVGEIRATSVASGQTLAQVDEDITAGELRVQAVAVNVADSKTEAAGGGAISSNSAVTQATVSPIVRATLADGIQVNVDYNVTVKADLTIDADAMATGTTGGGVDVGETESHVDADPIVEAAIGDDAVVNAGGSVIVGARIGGPLAIADGSFASKDVNTTTDAISTTGLHNLVDGDLVVYRGVAGAFPAGGLDPGRTYRVLLSGGQALKLGEAFDAAAVDGHTDTIHFATPHLFENGDRVVYEAGGNFPITGLADGGSYFVRVFDDLTIQLASTPSGAGLDLASSIGTHRLRFDLTTFNLGTHRLEGVGGALALLDPTEDDGILTSTAFGSNGAFIGVKGTAADVDSAPTLSAVVGTGAEVAALDDVRITTSANLRSTADAFNNSQGFIAVGQGEATATFDTTNTAQIGNSASVSAGDVFTMTAFSNHSAVTFADARGDGGFPRAQADAKSDIRHDTKADVGQSASISAGNSLTITSSSSTNGDATADADGDRGGAEVDALANFDFNSTNPRGVLIGRVSDPALTQTFVGIGAQLAAKTVELTADVTSLDVDVNVFSDGGGFEIDSLAVARAHLFDKADVTIASQADIYGADSIEITSRHGAVSSDALANADSGGVFRNTEANAINLQNTTSSINAVAGANLTTHDLTVSTDTNVTRFVKRAIRRGNEEGDDHEIGASNPIRDITFNADVLVLSGPAPELVVNEAGLVVRAVNVTFSNLTDRIAVLDVHNNDPGRVTFDTDPIASTPGTIQGDQSLITFQETFDTVTILNRSAKHLELNDIDPVNRLTSSSPVEVTIDVEDVDFEFEVAHSFLPTLIDIANTSVAAAPDVILLGGIENPIGQTQIRTPGSILDGASGAVMVRTNKLDFEAASGSVGSISSKLHVELVQSPGKSTSLTANAGDDLHFDLKGLLRDPSISTFTVQTGVLTAGDDISLIVREGVRQTVIPSNTYSIQVAEPQVPRTRTIKRFFPPPQFTPDFLPALPFGVFGGNPQTIDVTYFLGLLKTEHDIDINRAGAQAQVNLFGTTNILSGGRINVSTSGNVDLLEQTGNLNVGSIVSTAGDVILSAQASIVEFADDAASDVRGRNVTLSAQTGTIGTSANPLEIDSSTWAAGAVSGAAAGDIFLIETAGDLALGSVTSQQGSVRLEVLGGSILENGSDTQADVTGVNVALLAAAGAIGSATNELEVNTSLPAPGALTAAALQSVYITESSGGLNVQQVASQTGEVRLTVVDFASSGQNLVLLPQAIVSAANSIALRAADDFDMSAASSIAAGGVVTIQGDFGNQDAGLGSSLLVRGPVTGSLVQVLGGVDNDAIALLDWTAAANVNGSTGSDTLSLELRGGTVTTLESMTLLGDVIAKAAQTTARINGTLVLGASAGRFEVENGGPATDLIVAATFSGARDLDKRGPGTMQLSAANTYTGATIVSGGVLLVEGQQGGSPAQIVDGTLGGNGAVGALTTVDGVVSPGSNGPGKLTAVGGFTGSERGSFKVELNGTKAGLNHDQLAVQGAVFLNNLALLPTLGFSSSVGNTFTIVDNDGVEAVRGTFAGLAEGDSLTIGKVKFQISYRGGDGNDVVLTHLNTSAAFSERTVSSPIDENGVAVLTGVPVDPDPLDEFILLVDWGDGTPVERHEFPPGTEFVQLEHRYLDSRSTAYSIALEWHDQHGGGNSDRLEVVVLNVAPTLALDAPASGVRGQSRALTLLPSDLSPVDQAADFTYVVNWGDGTTNTVVGPAGHVVEHAYAATGSYDITATAIDKDGGASLPAVHTISIRSVELQGDTLVVGGTTGDDRISIEAADLSGAVRVEINRNDEEIWTPQGGIVVYGQAGDDLIAVEGKRIRGKLATIDVPALLDGGVGDDVLTVFGSTARNILLGGDGDDVLTVFGSTARNILLGGDGDDTLTVFGSDVGNILLGGDGDDVLLMIGGSSRDLLIGGRGHDLLVSDGGEDLLIGGSTRHDDHIAALDAILAEWGRTDLNRRERQEHLRGGEPGGLNGPYLLDDDSLIDDGAFDLLIGNRKRDWLL
jgi:autotransporter-associated beta strand protein